MASTRAEEALQTIKKIATTKYYKDILRIMGGEDINENTKYLESIAKHMIENEELIEYRKHCSLKNIKDSNRTAWYYMLDEAYSEYCKVRAQDDAPVGAFDEELMQTFLMWQNGYRP